MASPPKHDRIGGPITALVTPFRGDRVDYEALSRLIDWQLGEGIQGLAPCTLSGEGPTLSLDERLGVIRCCVEAADGRVPVIAATGSNCTDTTIAFTKAARQAGAAAALVVTPYYNRPGQRGLRHHFEVIARKVDIPFIVGNDPARTGIDLTPDTLEHLAAFPAIVGIADATGDLSRPLALSARFGRRFIQLSGHDATAFGFNTMGGIGTISAVSNLAPRLSAELQDACIRGDVHGARALHHRLRPLLSALQLESDPVPLKHALHLLRGLSPAVRLPLVPAEPRTEHAVRAALAALLEEPAGSARLRIQGEQFRRPADAAQREATE